MSRDRLFGLAYVCARFHSGQWSKGYRVLSRLRVNWGSDDASKLLPREEWEEARRWAAHYTRVARTRPGVF